MGEKWKFVTNVRQLKQAGKKLDEDALRLTKRYEWFLSNASNVLTKWIT